MFLSDSFGETKPAAKPNKNIKDDQTKKYNEFFLDKTMFFI